MFAGNHTSLPDQCRTADDFELNHQASAEAALTFELGEGTLQPMVVQGLAAEDTVEGLRVRNGVAMIPGSSPYLAQRSCSLQHYYASNIS